MIVYVVHPVRDNIAPALRFGDFKFITGGYVYGDLLEQRNFAPRRSVMDFPRLGDEPETISYTTDWVVPLSFQNSLEFAAHQFQPDTDYLLVVGDHLQLLAFTMMLGQLHGSFMVLRYDRKLDDYIPVRLHSHLVRHPAPVLQRTDIGETNNGQDGNQEVPRQPADEWVGGLDAARKRNPPGS